MAELLVRVLEREGAPVGRLKPGDVVTVAPDGHEWSQTELTNPAWRIVKVPGVPPAFFTELLEPRMSPDGRLALDRRVRCIDMTDQWLQGVIASGQVITVTPAMRAKFLSLRKARERDTSVAIIG